MKKSSFIKKINFIIIFIVAINFNACKEESEIIILSPEDELLLKEIVKCTEVSCTKENDIYELKVSNTKLNTLFGKEMGASIASLIIYNTVVNKNTMINYNTSLRILYSDDQVNFKYSLKDVSDALNGQTIIDEQISDLKNLNSQKNMNENHKILLNQSIDWSNITYVNFGGFSFDKINSDLVFFRVFFDDDKTEMRVFWNKVNNKILKIEWYNIN